MKSEKKVSLTTYLLTIFMVLLIAGTVIAVLFIKKDVVTLNKTTNNEQVAIKEDGEKTSTDEKISEVPGFDSESPEEIDLPDDWKKEFIKLTKGYAVNPSDEMWNYRILYNYLKSGYKDESVIKQFLDGDSTEIVLQESNYPQFQMESVPDKYHMYKEKIVCKVATVNEDLYLGALASQDQDSSEPTENDDMDKTTRMEYAKMANALGDRIEDAVKFQWDNLKQLKTYHSRDLSNEKYYYEIGKIVIGNGKLDSFIGNSRAKKIKVTLNGEKEYTFELEDTNKSQEFDIGYRQEGVEKPVNVEIEVLEAYNGLTTDDIYIDSIAFGITSNIPQGR